MKSSQLMSVEQRAKLILTNGLLPVDRKNVFMFLFLLIFVSLFAYSAGGMFGDASFVSPPR